MQIPFTARLHTAIELLKKLRQWLSTHATNPVVQRSDTHLVGNYAGRLEGRSIEQTSRIQTVARQLEHWRNELVQQRRQCAAHRV
jgi:hypothetical protein